MSDSDPLALVLLPGTLLVMILVSRDARRCALAVTPAELLHGLRAAVALLDFSEVLRSEQPPEELLPWAGNV